MNPTQIAVRFLTVLTLALACETAIAQVASIPRTAEGRPDLQGVWESRWFTTLERPPGAPAAVAEKDLPAFIAAAEAQLAQRPPHSNPDSDLDIVRTLAKAGDAYRTSQIIDPPDGRLPYSQEGRRLFLKNLQAGADDPEERAPSERCISGPGRAPMLSPPSNGYIQIVQPPDRVMIFAEAVSDVRDLPLEAAQARPFPTLNGDASTRWEGDALVIETRNMRDDARFFLPMSILLLSPQSVIVERIEPLSANEFRYSYSVTDPILYTRAWSAETTYVRSASKIYEYACHEGNYAMTNMLAGARQADRLKQ